MNHAYPGNSIAIHVNNQRDAYSDFAFLLEGWSWSRLLICTIKERGEYATV
jgi:hypothetical protein